jgi:hypothetical protein
MATSTIYNRVGSPTKATAARCSVGDQLVCAVTGFDDNNAATYQWAQCNTVGGSYTNISGATGAVFMVPAYVDTSKTSSLTRFLKCTAAQEVGAEAASVTSSATVAITRPARSSGVGRTKKTEQPMKMFQRVARGSQNSRQIRVGR